MYINSSQLHIFSEMEMKSKDESVSKYSTLELNNKELAEELNNYKTLYIESKELCFERDKHIQVFNY